MNFQIISTIILILAVIHTFLTPILYGYAQKLAKKKTKNPEWWKHYHFISEVVYLLSEVEVVFGIWLIPLMFFFTITEGWREAINYVNTRNYTHALYITVVVVVIGSRPIITFAERILEWIARVGRDTPGAWWWTILTIGPLLGAIIKEPAAMALCAILLGRKFYTYQPSRNFQYATLGLLFANISVGGMLTTFSSRALFVVADALEWDWVYMLTHFGWKVVIGLLLTNGLYYFTFRKEFSKEIFPKALPTLEKDEAIPPFWITLIHLIFLTLVVLTAEFAPLFMGVFILFLGFWRATPFYQGGLHLRSAILVGFFFASLVIHGELQGWWVIPLMRELNHFGAMGVSYLLSAVMDNAIVNYFSLEIPEFDDLKRYLVVSGAMAGGALTVIANAPNPVGHAILRPIFRKGRGVSFTGIFLGALPPSLIFLGLFWFFK